MSILRRVGVWPAVPGRFHTVGRLILLAGLVGVVAGLGAVVFQFLSQMVVSYGLTALAGYSPHGPTGEWKLFARVHPVFREMQPWMILVVITMGGLISGIIVFKIAPEAEGHGTDAAIKAYHRNRGIIRPIVPLVKIFASAITLGSGGSGGREGPIAQIGAGFGSFLGRMLKLSESERRMLLVAGMGAGIAAIFRAPLAGAIFAIEVLYREEDFEAEALIPAFISCTVAYCVFAMIATYALHITSGFEPLFTVQPGLHFNHPMLLAPLTILAIVMVAASLVYVRCFYGCQRLFHLLPMKPHLKPAVGALGTGLFALGIFYALSGAGRQAQHDSLSVLSFGYGILQKLLDGQIQLGLPAAIALLLAVGLGKILTTSMTIGSGGSGGVFGPSMVIGGTLGAASGLLLQKWMPGTVTRVDMFVILGMAGFFSAAAKVPVSTIIMVSELTSSYELLLPSMWVCAIAYLLSRGWSIYREQVPSRLQSPAHRGDFIVGVLKGITVGDIWKAGERIVCFHPETPLVKVMEAIPTTRQTAFPVLDKERKYSGLFSLNQIRRLIYQKEFSAFAIVSDVAAQSVEPLHTDTELPAAMVQFAAQEYEELPIVSSDSRQEVLGLLKRKDVIAAYNHYLSAAMPAKS